MEIEYSAHFRRVYYKLPPAIQRKAERREAIFRSNPFDPRLDTHKLHGKLKNFHSFSIDSKYRIAFYFLKPKSRVVFLDVGDHDIYR